MSSSSLAFRHHRRTKKPLVGFLVGRYFAQANGRPDYNGITRNIEEAVRHALRLWQAGFLVFLPHLNTHHFEVKTQIDPDPLENEEYYRAFDRKLMQGIDFVYASPNWRQSSGGKLEVALARHLGIPVFESLEDLILWANGETGYSEVEVEGVSEAAKNFGGAKEMKIALVDGPYWAQIGAEPDMPTIGAHALAAEEVAIGLFNNRVAAFTPQLNASVERLRYHVPHELYQTLCDEILKRVADCHVLTPGWDSDPDTRRRIVMATRLGKPSFLGLNEVLAWRDSRKGYAVVRIK